MERVDLDTRKGIIELPYRMFNPRDLYVVHAAMRDVLVMRCEILHMADVMRYEGYCPHFRALEPGEMMPTYDVEVDEDENGVINEVIFHERVAVQ